MIFLPAVHFTPYKTKKEKYIFLWKQPYSSGKNNSTKIILVAWKMKNKKVKARKTKHKKSGNVELKHVIKGVNVLQKLVTNVM